MAKVWLTYKQCSTGRSLPRCCIVCGGEDEVEFLERDFEYTENWVQWMNLLHILSFFGSSFFGLFGFFRFERELTTHFPYCEDHYDFWHKNDLIKHLGILILAVGALVPLLISFVMYNHMRLNGILLTIAVLSIAVGVLMVLYATFKCIHISCIDESGFQFIGVSEEFCESVVEAREKRACKRKQIKEEEAEDT